MKETRLASISNRFEKIELDMNCRGHSCAKGYFKACLSIVQSDQNWGGKIF